MTTILDPETVRRLTGQKQRPEKPQRQVPKGCKIHTIINHFPPTIPAETVRAIRRDRANKLTVRETAEKHGVSTGYVSRVCRGIMRQDVK